MNFEATSMERRVTNELAIVVNGRRLGVGLVTLDCLHLWNRISHVISQSHHLTWNTIPELFNKMALSLQVILITLVIT